MKKVHTFLLLFTFLQLFCGCEEKAINHSVSLKEMEKQNDSIIKERNWCHIFDNNYIDVGRIGNDKDMASATFFLENSTDKNQFIDTIVTSCGCTLAYYNKKVIRPNTKDSVVIKIDLHNVRGRFIQLARVYFHGCNENPVTLTVKGIKEW